MDAYESPNQPEMIEKPRQEHVWLHQLVGRWSCEGEALMAPGQPPERFQSTETVRSFGGLWVIAEGKGTCPTGEEVATNMTLGFDPRKMRFVGTWFGSMMTHLWIYEGELDAGGKVLTLRCEGPDMTVEGRLAAYKDVIALENSDHRILTAHMQGEDGVWQQIMTAHYRREA